MVYVVGFIGFIFGFILGQLVLLHLLRERSRRDLVMDKSLRWTYGILNWIIAGLSSYSFVFMYNQYYG